MADEEEIWNGEDGYEALGWDAWEGEQAPKGQESFGPGLIDVNPRAYSKYPLERLVGAAHDGDLELLQKMLDREDPINGYHADINAFQTNGVNALQAAAVNGQLEAVEMLIKAGADPHVKTSAMHGHDPKEGETAREMADKWGWDDVVQVLKHAEGSTPKGVYRSYGLGNNAKLWPINRPQGLDPAQEKRAMKRHKGLVRPLPGRGQRKFYGDMVFGLTHGVDEQGNTVRPGARRARQAGQPAATEPVTPAEAHVSIPSHPLSAVPGAGLLFPGQGSQYVKMLEDARNLPLVQQMLKTADRILGFDLQEACLDGPDSRLEKPEICFPAVYVAGLAALEKLRDHKAEAVEQPGAVAGLGVGEYTALAAAGVFEFETGLGLVKVLGTAVAQFSQEPAQATLSVAGLERSALEPLCASVSASAGGVCQISQELFPKGFTCAGSRAAMEELKEMVDKNGALQSKVLSTYGAIHSEFMASVKVKLRRALDEFLPKMKPPRCDVYMNSIGKAVPSGTDPAVIAEHMCEQFVSPVLWQTLVGRMIAAGIEEFYEVGPQKQLKAMMKRIDSTSWAKTANIEV